MLDKVKKLLLLPDIEMLTTQEVADYYEVNIDAIKWHIRRNRDELDSDGLVLWKLNNFRNESNSLLKINTCVGGFIVDFPNGSSLCEMYKIKVDDLLLQK